MCVQPTQQSEREQSSDQIQFEMFIQCWENSIRTMSLGAVVCHLEKVDPKWTNRLPKISTICTELIRAPLIWGLFLVLTRTGWGTAGDIWVQDFSDLYRMMVKVIFKTFTEPWENVPWKLYLEKPLDNLQTKWKCFMGCYINVARYICEAELYSVV